MKAGIACEIKMCPLIFHFSRVLHGAAWSNFTNVHMLLMCSKHNALIVL